MLYLVPEPGREQRRVDDGLGLEDVERCARDLPLGQRALPESWAVLSLSAHLH